MMIITSTEARLYEAQESSLYGSEKGRTTLPDIDSHSLDARTTRYTEIYCASCKKSLGRYNTNFYSNDKIIEMLKTAHAVHVKEGHTINTREFKE